MKLLSTNNYKTKKGEKKGFMTFILHLAPHTQSGKYNVCPMASKGCAAACLNTAGRGAMNVVQNARIQKTRRFFEDREGFMADLVWDIEAAIRKADREGFIPVFRLNGTSDIRWENIPVKIPADFTPCPGSYRNIMEAYPWLVFYDYTKLPNRRNIPHNYHLTFSRAEDNEHLIPEALRNGMNVAVVFDTHKSDDLPSKWGAGPRILPVEDGDETDLRFLDISPSIVGLRAKGKGKKDESGFVVEVTA